MREIDEAYIKNLAKRFSRRRRSQDYADIEQDAYVGALIAARTYDSNKKCTYKTWVYMCVRREVIDRGRENQSFFKRLQFPETLKDIVDQPTQHRDLMTNQIMQAISAWDDEDKKILLEPCIGKTHKEVGEELGKSRWCITRQRNSMIDRLRRKVKG